LTRRRFAAALSFLCFARAAGAQPSAADEAAAESLYLEAERLIDAGRPALACAKLRESQRLDPQLGTLLHLADCYEQNGQTASAWVTFREAAEVATTRGDSRAETAIARAAALATRLATITIAVPNELPGLEVQRDGRPITPAMWGSAIPVDPGTTRVEARAPHRQTWSEEIRVSGPGATVITVPPLAPANEGSHAAKRTTLGWIGIASGGALLAAGGILTAIATSKSNDADAICPSGVGCTRDELQRYDSIYTDARSSAIAAGITAGIGGTLVLGGLLILLLDRPTRARASAGAFAW
jgi:hypothetical protein